MLQFSRAISAFGTSIVSPRRFSSTLQSVPRWKNAIDKALRVLDIVTPKSSSTRHLESANPHARLIQSCIENLLRASGETRPKKPNKALVRIVTEEIQSSHDGKIDHFLVLQELLRRGFLPDQVVLSGALSLCGDAGDLGTGLQLQSLSVKIYLDKSIPVVSSLISLYSKCGELGSAYQLFEETPIRNTVLYTSIISAMSQHCCAESSLELFVDMKRSAFEPNDYTFASILSACTDIGWLGIGRSVHCLEFQMGFNSYVYVSNSLISMYAKCGNIEDASYLFRKMASKDLISWNSMISGLAQYGLARKALSLLEEMNELEIKPDAITFLAVLSSCRHAGLVEEARKCFNSMLKLKLLPNLDHYSCVVDLLGRAGLLREALEFILKMPIRPNAVIWGSLLSSCKVHGNIPMGMSAACSRLLLEPGCAATHVQLANLYAVMGCWDEFAKIRKLMKERGLKTIPGCSWIEVGNEIYKFRAEGRRSKFQVNEAIYVLDSLDGQMKYLEPIDDHLMFPID